MRRNIGILTLTSLFVPPHLLFGQCFDWKPGQGIPGLNGIVHAMVEWDNGSGPALYVGGHFSIAGDTFATNVARWNGIAWSSLGDGVGATDDSVFALTIYNDELIAGGSVYYGLGSHVQKWDGVTWSTVGNGMSHVVWALSVYNGNLIAGGGFNNAGGTSANRIARWNGTAWFPLDVGVNANVFALHVVGDELIVGGAFTAAGGISANGIARWNGSTWSPLGSGVTGGQNGFASGVYTISQYAGQLVVGGNFTTAGALNANYIATWDGTNWSTFGSGMNEAVDALAVYNNELLAGGINIAGGVGVGGLARWDGTIWSRLAPNGVLWSVYALTGFNGNLIAGGNLTPTGGEPTTNVASWDGATWSKLGAGMTDRVLALAEYGGELVAGGKFFTNRDGAYGNHIARWNGTTWAGLGTGISGYVYALAVFNDELTAGGSFGVAGGNDANYIAGWNGKEWMPLGEGMDGEVHALAVYNGELIAGGEFTSAGGTTALRVARWNGTAWSAIGSGLNSTVRALLVYNGDLIAGGDFTAVVGGPAATRVARWDGAAWSPLGSGLSSPSNPEVNAFAVYDGELIAGGHFAVSGGYSFDSVARWNGTSWTALGYSDGTVDTLSAYNGELIAGGAYIFGIHNIAKWNGTIWSSLGNGIVIKQLHLEDVNALTAFSGDLVVGGGFTVAGGRPSAYWARWGPGPGPYGACCITSTCQDTLDCNCANLGGAFHGVGTTCQNDADADGVSDFCDNCELHNPEQLDCQPNGIGDVCDISEALSSDCDHDGKPDECQLSEHSVYSASANILIPDNGGSGNPAVHTINVSDSISMEDVEIGLTVTHTWVGDLVATVSHGETTVTVIDRPGRTTTGFGCGADNYVGTILDDEGSGGAIESVCIQNISSPPSYIPNGALSAFDGMNAAGAWTLRVSDHETQDTGTLVSWSVRIRRSTPVDCDPPAPIPTTSTWGLIVMTLALAVAGTCVLQKKLAA